MMGGEFVKWGRTAGELARSERLTPIAWDRHLACLSDQSVGTALEDRDEPITI